MADDYGPDGPLMVRCREQAADHVDCLMAHHDDTVSDACRQHLIEWFTTNYASNYLTMKALREVRMEVRALDHARYWTFAGGVIIGIATAYIGYNYFNGGLL